jgi:hypothetical protein
MLDVRHAAGARHFLMAVRPARRITSAAQYVGVCRRIDPLLHEVDGRLIAVGWNHVRPREWVEHGLARFIGYWEAVAERPDRVGSPYNQPPELVMDAWRSKCPEGVAAGLASNARWHKYLRRRLRGRLLTRLRRVARAVRHTSIGGADLDRWTNRALEALGRLSPELQRVAIHRGDLAAGGRIMTKKYSFSHHPEHKAKLDAWRDKWIANAMSCKPMTDAERRRYVTAARGLYRAANLPSPKAIVFARGPLSGALAAGIAAGVWYLREHPEKHVELFGGAVSEKEMLAAIPVACRFAVVSAFNALHETKLPLPPIGRVRATRAATDVATRAATTAATRAATDVATRAATDAATTAATTAATRAATDAATDAATGAATRDATDAATRAATLAAVDDAVHAATCAAVDDAVDAATLVAVDEATRAAVDDAVRAATNAATCAAVDDAVDAATPRSVATFLIRCTQYSWQMLQGGNQWSGWTAYLSFFRHVSKLDLDYSKFAHFEMLAHAGPRYMHARFCIISERPEWIKIDERRLPHSPNGPSHRWRDGFSLYYWHGVRVPRAWIESPSSIDPKTALTWRNIEQRRALADIIGWKKIIDQLTPKIVDIDADPQIGTLLEVDLPDNGPARFLKVECGTGREFVLSVPTEMRTARQANAWTYGIDPDELNLEVRT